MTLEEIRDLINLIANKTNYGNTLTPADYNTLLESENKEFYKRKMEEYEIQNGNPNSPTPIFSSKILREFKTTASVTMTAGAGNLPADYSYWSSARTTYGGTIKNIELVSENEKNDRLFNMLGKNPTLYPMVVLRGGVVNVWPTDITPITLDYFKTPSQPVYDYYVDANGNETALAASGTVQLSAGERGSQGQSAITSVAITGVNQGNKTFDVTGDITANLINASTFDVSGSTGNDGTYTIVSYLVVGSDTRITVSETIPNAVVDGSIDTVVLASQTVELEYNEDLHLEFADNFLSRMGVRLRDGQLIEYSQMQQQQSSAL